MCKRKDIYRRIYKVKDRKSVQLEFTHWAIIRPKCLILSLLLADYFIQINIIRTQKFHGMLTVSKSPVSKNNKI